MPILRAQKSAVTDTAQVKHDLYEKYPAFRNVGELTLHPDEDFTSENTGAGSIEYMSPTTDTIRYPSGLKYPHPKPGTHAIIYNPNSEDMQGIEMDMVHAMRTDKEYLPYLNAFEGAVLDKFKYDKFRNYDRENPNQEYGDGYEQWKNNSIDGDIRGLMFEGTSQDYKNKHYWEGLRGLYLADPAIKKSYEDLMGYLKTKK
jgi:hypothetical protein